MGKQRKMKQQSISCDIVITFALGSCDADTEHRVLKTSFVVNQLKKTLVSFRTKEKTILFWLAVYSLFFEYYAYRRPSAAQFKWNTKTLEQDFESSMYTMPECIERSDKINRNKSASNRYIDSKSLSYLREIGSKKDY